MPATVVLLLAWLRPTKQSFGDKCVPKCNLGTRGASAPTNAPESSAPCAAFNFQMPKGRHKGEWRDLRRKMGAWEAGFAILSPARRLISRSPSALWSALRDGVWQMKSISRF
jgi:hypothetical protein